LTNLPFITLFVKPDVIFNFDRWGIQEAEGFLDDEVHKFGGALFLEILIVESAAAVREVEMEGVQGDGRILGGETLVNALDVDREL
jgi:hypothetical protein